MVRNTRMALAYWVIPLVLAAIYLAMAWRTGWFGSDFRASLWEPSRELLAGGSPYPAADPAALAGNPFLYTPLIFGVGVPLSFLPLALAEVAWSALMAAAIAATAWVLGVRDWRCYGIALLTLPTLDGLAVGNITFAIVFALALAWCHRDRPWVCGALLGLSVALKPFLWPLLLWLLVTRRMRTAAIALAVGAGSTLASWAAIGFDGMGAYPHLISAFNEVVRSESFSVFSLASGLGVAPDVATLLQYAAGAALVGAALVAARDRGRDRDVFVLLLIAALILSPIVWRHYFALLLVPIAMSETTLRRAWFVPLAFWLTVLIPGDAPLRTEPYQRRPAETAMVLALTLIVAFLTTRPPVRRASRRAALDRAPAPA